MFGEIEFTVAYWWLIELTAVCALLFTAFKTFDTAIKTRRVVNGWSVPFVIFVLLLVVNPIKKDGTNKNEVVKLSNTQISQLKKDVPKKVEDNSFNQSVKDVPISITKEELEVTN